MSAPRCNTQKRFRPASDGDGFARCGGRPIVEVTYRRAKSTMMRGPYYLCSACVDDFRERLEADFDAGDIVISALPAIGGRAHGKVHTQRIIDELRQPSAAELTEREVDRLDAEPIR